MNSLNDSLEVKVTCILVWFSNQGQPWSQIHSFFLRACVHVCVCVCVCRNKDLKDSLWSSKFAWIRRPSCKRFAENN